MEKNNEILEEGLKYFKTSTKLRKLALKIQEKSKYVEPDKFKQLEILSRKLNSLAFEFEETENLYSIGNKQAAKFKYKNLNAKYINVLKEVNKDSTKNALKTIKMVASTIAFMTIPYMLMSKFFPTLNSTQTEENDKLKHLLKRSGAYMLCSIPLRTASYILDKRINVYDEQIIKNLSERFPEVMEA